jgi:ribosomal protein S25
MERVPLNLNQAIIQFWNERVVAVNSRFTSTELRQYVQHYNYGTAPSSADRVLRKLREEGKINYILVNRSLSLYQALPLEEKPNA